MLEVKQGNRGKPFSSFQMWKEKRNPFSSCKMWKENPIFIPVFVESNWPEESKKTKTKTKWFEWKNLRWFKK